MKASAETNRLNIDFRATRLFQKEIAVSTVVDEDVLHSRSSHDICMAFLHEEDQ